LGMNATDGRTGLARRASGAFLPRSGSNGWHKAYIQSYYALLKVIFDV
jgi:hypothetical protein